MNGPSESRIQFGSTAILASFAVKRIFRTGTSARHVLTGIANCAFKSGPLKSEMSNTLRYIPDTRAHEAVCPAASVSVVLGRSQLEVQR